MWSTIVPPRQNPNEFWVDGGSDILLPTDPDLWASSVTAVCILKRSSFCKTRCIVTRQTVTFAYFPWIEISLFFTLNLRNGPYKSCVFFNPSSFLLCSIHSKIVLNLRYSARSLFLRKFRVVYDRIICFCRKISQMWILKCNKSIDTDQYQRWLL